MLNKFHILFENSLIKKPQFLYSIHWNFTQRFSKVDRTEPQYSQNVIDQTKKMGTTFYQQQVAPSQNSSADIIQVKSPEQLSSALSQGICILYCFATWNKPSLECLKNYVEEIKKRPGRCKFLAYDIELIPQFTQSLNIKTLPTAILMKDKNVVDWLPGVPTAQSLESFFKIIDNLYREINENEVFQQYWTKGLQELSGKDYKNARKSFEELMKGPKWIKIAGAEILSCYAFSCFGMGDNLTGEQALKDLREKFPTAESENQEVKIMMNEIKKLHKADEEKYNDPQIIALQNLLKKEPNELNHYQLAELLLKKKLYNEGCSILLQLIKKNQKWEDKKAQKLLFQTFSEMGSQNTLVSEYRKKLQNILVA